jgi:hypothetical protein
VARRLAVGRCFVVLILIDTVAVLLLFLLLMLKKWISIHDDDVLVLVDVF